jgi:hypothetical protein
MQDRIDDKGYTQTNDVEFNTENTSEEDDYFEELTEEPTIIVNHKSQRAIHWCKSCHSVHQGNTPRSFKKLVITMPNAIFRGFEPHEKPITRESTLKKFKHAPIDDEKILKITQVMVPALIAFDIPPPTANDYKMLMDYVVVFGQACYQNCLTPDILCQIFNEVVIQPYIKAALMESNARSNLRLVLEVLSDRLYSIARRYNFFSCAKYNQLYPAYF